MRLTDRTDYALRVLMILASSGQRHTVPALAEAFGVSANHLTKVVQALQGLGLAGGGRLDFVHPPNLLASRKPEPPPSPGPGWVEAPM